MVWGRASSLQDAGQAKDMHSEPGERAYPTPVRPQGPYLKQEPKENRQDLDLQGSGVWEAHSLSCAQTEDGDEDKTTPQWGK